MFLEVSLSLLKGFLTTCSLFFTTLVFSLPLGLLIAFGAISSFKPLKAVIRTLIWIIRGTPLMLQIIVIFYGPGLIFGASALPRYTAVVIAFVINYACYFAEIYRGGIESVSKGQYEAGQVLGMTKGQIFFKIILFQIIRRILAAMSNEVISLVKDTSLARVIVVAEILKVAQDWAAKALIWPLFYTGIFYLVFVGLLTILFHFCEKKMNYYKV